MPVTEAEAWSALPQTGWLRRYVIHAEKQTTAPIIYHFGVGLTLLAVTSPLAYGMHYAGTLRTNNFGLLVGRSGEDNKSSALRVGYNLLHAAAPPLIGDFPGSPEGLLESLANTPSQLIPISEFGKFLSSAKAGYFEPIKALLADVWDCDPVQRAKANQKIIRVEDPRLSIVAACSIPYLEKYTLSEDWTGGFMGRWMVLYGRRERNDPDPVGDNTDFQWLADELQRRASQPTAGWCTGLTPAAKTLWTQWYTQTSNANLPSNIVGIRARAPTIARKIALIYGWDFGPAQLGQPWKMDIDILEPALKLTDLHIKSLVHLAGIIAEHDDARMRRSILQAIDDFGGQATLGEIISVLKMRKRTIMETLDSLMEEGRVRIDDTRLNGKIVYTRT